MPLILAEDMDLIISDDQYSAFQDHYWYVRPKFSPKAVCYDQDIDRLLYLGKGYLEQAYLVKEKL